MIKFTTRHTARLAATFARVDDLLTEAIHRVDLAALRSPFSKYVADVTPVQQQLIFDYAQRVRAAMRAIGERHNIPLPQPTASALLACRTALNDAVTAAEELGPSYMCAYGPLTGELEAELNRVVPQLLDMLDQMEGFIALEEGADLRARVDRLSRTRPDTRLLDELARVIAEHGLAQFNAPLEALIERFEADDFEVAVFGRTNSGKSTLVNRLLGAEIVPAGAMPVTTVPVST
ncbi:MAG: dynamin family protein [Comamonadaceae bacterium]|nr:dynamin family protein [Comamonadaceae bacterium]